MIPSLTTLAERLGMDATLFLMALAGLFTASVLLFQSIAQWFDDRNS